MNSPSSSQPKANSEADLTKKSVLELEQILIREEDLLKNTRFIEKLPDKGAKLRKKVVYIDELIQRRLNECNSAENDKKRCDVENLEWDLKVLSTKTNGNSSTSKIQPEATVTPLDSDDDEPPPQPQELDNDTRNETEVETAIRLLATSQISQRQPKSLVNLSDSSRTKGTGNSPSSTSSTSLQEYPLYVTKCKLADVLENKSPKSRFVLNHPKLLQPQVTTSDAMISPPTSANDIDMADNVPPVDLSNVSLNEHENQSGESPLSRIMDSGDPNCDEQYYTDSNGKRRKRYTKWDEALVTPVPSVHKFVKPLTLEESVDLSIKEARRLKELKGLSELKNKIGPVKAIKSAALEGSAFSFRPQRIPLDEDDNEDDMEVMELDNVLEEETEEYHDDTTASESGDGPEPSNIENLDLSSLLGVNLTI